MSPAAAQRHLRPGATSRPRDLSSAKSANRPLPPTQRTPPRRRQYRRRARPSSEQPLVPHRSRDPLPSDSTLSKHLCPAWVLPISRRRSHMRLLTSPKERKSGRQTQRQKRTGACAKRPFTLRGAYTQPKFFCISIPFATLSCGPARMLRSADRSGATLLLARRPQAIKSSGRRSRPGTWSGS